VYGEAEDPSPALSGTAVSSIVVTAAVVAAIVTGVIGDDRVPPVSGEGGKLAQPYQCQTEDHHHGDPLHRVSPLAAANSERGGSTTISKQQGRGRTMS